VALSHNEVFQQPFLPGNTDTFSVKFHSAVSDPLAIRLVYRSVLRPSFPKFPLRCQVADCLFCRSTCVLQKTERYFDVCSSRSQVVRVGDRHNAERRAKVLHNSASRASCTLHVAHTFFVLPVAFHIMSRFVQCVFSCSHAAFIFLGEEKCCVRCCRAEPHFPRGRQLTQC
jgi:hypothetical protein